MTEGRPSKYKEKYNQEVIEYMGQGYSKEAFAGKIGVSSRAIFRWIKRYPKFRRSIKKAEAACQNFWEGLGIELVLAGQGNATAWIFNMKNRFRKTGWNDMRVIDKTIRKVKPLIPNNVHNNDGSKKAT